MIIQRRNGTIRSGRQARENYKVLRDYHNAVFENQEAQKRREKVEPTNGPRAKFFELIEQEDLSIDEAINKFLEENKAFEEKDVIKWLKEDLKKRKFTEGLLNKIMEFLNNRQKKFEDDGR